MVLEKDQQNCILPILGKHDEPIASENFSAINHIQKENN